MTTQQLEDAIAAKDILISDLVRALTATSEDSHKTELQELRDGLQHLGNTLAGAMVPESVLPSYSSPHESPWPYKQPRK